MKITALIFVLAAALCVSGQNSKTLPAGPVDGVAGNWSSLGSVVPGENGYSLSGKGIRTSGAGRYQLWVKIVPSNYPSFTRRYSIPRETNYVLQFATVDCGRRNVFLEKTTLYDANAQLVAGRTEALTPSSKKSTVKAGSIGESIFKAVCDEPNPPPSN